MNETVVSIQGLVRHQREGYSTAKIATIKTAQTTESPWVKWKYIIQSTKLYTHTHVYNVP